MPFVGEQFLVAGREAYLILVNDLNAYIRFPCKPNAARVS